MFAQIVQTHLGKYSMMLLDFYLAHHIVFNLLVLGYGVVLIVAHRNFERVSEKILQKMKNESLAINSAYRALKEERVFWESLKSELKIPIIAGRSSFLFRSFTADNVIAIMKKREGG